MEIKSLNIEKLKPYKNNARNNEKAVDKVVASIKEFGFRVPILIDNDNEIIAGHTRLLAAKKLGLKEVSTIKVDDLTPEQVKAFRIADNKTAEYADWNFELLAQELEDLKLADYDLSLTGFDMSEAEKLLDSLKEGIDGNNPDDDFDIVLPEEPITQRGNIWILGNHKLMCGDSCTEIDVKKLMGEDRAQMVFEDLPYNVSYGAVEHPNYRKRSIMNDSMSDEDFMKFMDSTFKAMHQFLQDGCMIYVCMSAKEFGNMKNILEEQGYHWSTTIIWSKDTAVLSRGDYHQRMEQIFYGWEASAPRLHPLKDRKQNNVWEISRPKKSELHPTQKSIELVVRAIKNSSNMKNIVVDLFGGSGTTLIACEETDRKCRMMELDPKYADVIVKRYINKVGNDNDVYLVRDGVKIRYSDLIKDVAEEVE